jgi:hypothetical protein
MEYRAARLNAMIGGPPGVCLSLWPADCLVSQRGSNQPDCVMGHGCAGDPRAPAGLVSYRDVDGVGSQRRR